MKRAECLVAGSRPYLSKTTPKNSQGSFGQAVPDTRRGVVPVEIVDVVDIQVELAIVLPPVEVRKAVPRRHT